MSTTRTYALRSRPDAGVATQPQPQNISILRRDEPSSARDLSPHMPGSLLHCPRAGLGQSQLALARGQLGPGPGPTLTRQLQNILPMSKKICIKKNGS